MKSSPANPSPSLAKWPVAAAILAPALIFLEPGATFAANIAPGGSAIFGFNDAMDADAGEEYAHTGQNASWINDSNAATRTDNWKGDNGGDGGLDFSYAGILWSAARTDKVTTLKITLVTFYDGGWFGPARSDPGAGGILGGSYLLAPSVQVTTNGGTTWTTVPSTSDYLSVMNGHQIGGGTAPNPTTRASTFTLNTPQTGIDGIRIIGQNGGTGDGGFLAVAELEIESIDNDTDNDGMDDLWETDHGLLVGTNDAALDPDTDGLSNLLEFQRQTDPQNDDTDDDGLRDGAEVNTHQTDPLLADTDGDGLSDGQEVTVSLTSPKIADTDADGLTDGQEVNTYGTNPQAADTDNDGYPDGIEVRLYSDPKATSSIPANIAPSGTAIIGTSTSVEGGTDTPYSQQNTPQVINDALPGTRVDTFNGAGTDPVSYAGITWPAPLAVAVDRLDFTMAMFVDGGWFGKNNAGPGQNGVLTAADYLVAPSLQVTTDGITWTTVPSSSNYLALLEGHILAGVTTGRASFKLNTPQTNLRGIRLIGTEGGTASGGFLGVWELGVGTVTTAGNPNIAPLGTAIMGTSTELSGGLETKYSQQGRPDLINDGQYGTRVDTFGRNDAYAFAGIVWPNTRTVPIDRVEATFFIFGDGGWFGPNNFSNPDLRPTETLVEPQLQVTTDGGLTWTVEPHASTYLTAMTGMTVPGNTSPNVVFALNTPRAGINGIRLIGSEGGTASGGFIGVSEFEVRETAATPANIALTATGFTGTNDAVDADGGRPYGQAGFPHNVNDGSEVTRVDTFDGAGGVAPVSYAALVWPSNRPVTLKSLTINLANFVDGGWFGPAGTGPAAGGALTSPDFLTAPSVQVMDATGVWSAAPASSDYLAAMSGHTIGGGANPNPTSKSSTLTLTNAQTVYGVRVIGDAGGSASGGFLGVYELTASGDVSMDSDGDGQSDAAEALAGTDPNNPNSVLVITALAKNGNSIDLTWKSIAGKTYQIQISDDLKTGSWSNLGGVIAGSASGENSVTAPLPSPATGRLFLRIKVVP